MLTFCVKGHKGAVRIPHIPENIQFPISLRFCIFSDPYISDFRIQTAFIISIYVVQSNRFHKCIRSLPGLIFRNRRRLIRKFHQFHVSSIHRTCTLRRPVLIRRPHAGKNIVKHCGRHDRCRCKIISPFSPSVSQTVSPFLIVLYKEGHIIAIFSIISAVINLALRIQTILPLIKLLAAFFLHHLRHTM